MPQRSRTVVYMATFISWGPRDGLVSPDQPPALELLAGLRHAVVGPLLARPRHEVLDALVQRHARAKVEQMPEARHVGHAVADVALAEAPDDLRRQRDAERARDRLGERGHRGRATGPDVERDVGDVLAGQRQ